MKTKQLVKRWFEVWEGGNFEDIPVTKLFSHTSPYGKIDGKAEYLALVNANRDKFLGHSFEIHDEIYEDDRACVRYTTRKEDFALEVSEWYYMQAGAIQRIVSYYNIEGRISDERKLKWKD